MRQFGCIGENRFWELRYFIPIKTPGNKLTEKKVLSKEKLLLKQQNMTKKSLPLYFRMALLTILCRFINEKNKYLRRF